MSWHEAYWRELHDLIERVAAAGSVAEALTTAVHHSTDIVPADRGAALFTLRSRYPRCIRWPAYASGRIRDFNSHYNRRVPVRYSGTEPVLGPVSWSAYDDSEYVCDFHRPLGIEESVGASFVDAFAGQRYVLWAHRNGAGRHFKEEEVITLRLICTTLGGLISLRSEIDAASRESLCDIELGPDADVLSRREAQVARLICRRMSMREIAGVLKISPRTVERHALHIYQKLGVANRKQLARLLLKGIGEW